MDKKKKKQWRESVVFLLIFLLTSSLIWLGLSKWKRTSHIYAYDEGTNIEKETELADAGDKDTKEEENTQTTPPQQQEEQSDYEDSKADADNTKEKKQGDSSKTKKSTQGEPEEDGDEGDGEGEGDGDGSGEESGDEGTDVSSTESPAGTYAPEEKEDIEPVKATSTPAPTATESPDDEVVSLVCTWDDKDSLVYKKTIPKDTIKVVAKYSSGKEAELDASDYTIAGLKNDSVGQHIMTVVYQNVMCRVTYKVNNYTKSIDYEWDTKDKCYKGELMNDDVLTVTAYMADDSEVELKSSQYTLSGIDNQKTGSAQTFTITYQEFTLTGTCRFLERKITYVDQYYAGGELVGTETSTVNDVKEEDEIEDNEDVTVTWKGTEYIGTGIKVVVDGKEKSARPYRVGERNFDIQVTRNYEEK